MRIALGDRRDQQRLVLGELGATELAVGLADGRHQARQVGLDREPQVALESPAHIDLAGGLALEEARDHRHARIVRRVEVALRADHRVLAVLRDVEHRAERDRRAGPRGVAPDIGGRPQVLDLVGAHRGRLALLQQDVALGVEGRRGGDSQEENRNADVDDVATPAPPVAADQAH